VVRVSWSPSGTHLCSTHTNGDLRIWDTTNWTCQRWNLSGGSGARRVVSSCKALAWSPGGKYLTVAAKWSSQLHIFEAGKSQAKLFRTENLHEREIRQEGFRFRVGGAISEIAWDPTGERFAVSFLGRASGLELVALYAVRQTPVVEFTLRGYIRGPPGHEATDPKPSLLQFANKCGDGALLTIAWTNSVVSFVPLLFVSEKRLTSAGVVNMSW